MEKSPDKQLDSYFHNIIETFIAETGRNIDMSVLEDRNARIQLAIEMDRMGWEPFTCLEVVAGHHIASTDTIGVNVFGLAEIYKLSGKQDPESFYKKFNL